MRLKEFLEATRGYDPELNVELTKILFHSQIDGVPVEARLDFPVIGLAQIGDDLYLVLEAAPEIISFGSKMRRLDGKPVSKKDVGL